MLPGRISIAFCISAVILSVQCFGADLPIVTIRVAGTDSIAERLSQEPIPSLGSGINVQFGTLDGIATVDSKRPWAVAFWLPEDLYGFFTGKVKPPLVLIAPTREFEHQDRRKFVIEFSKEQKPEVTKLAKNLYRRVDGETISFILVDGDITLVGPTQALIEQIRPRAAEFLRENEKTSLFSARMELSQIPHRLKDAMTSSVQSAGQEQANKSDSARQIVDLIDVAVRDFLEGCESISVGVDTAPDVEGISFWLKVDSLNGSRLDDTFRLLPPLGSRYAGRIDPGATLNIAISCRFTEKVSKFISSLNPGMEVNSVKDLKQDDRFRELKSEYTELCNEVEITALTIQRLGRIDAVYSMTKTGDDMKMDLSAFIPGAKRIDGPLKAFLQKAKAIDRTGVIDTEISQVSGLPIHRIDAAGYLTLVEDDLIMSTESARLQRSIATQTTEESRRRTPPILVEGDLSVIGTFVFSALKRMTSRLVVAGDPKLRGRVRFAVENKNHSLSAVITLDREAVQSIFNAYAKETSRSAVSEFRDFEEKAASAHDGVTMLGDPSQQPSDALRPSNVSRRNRSRTRRSGSAEKP